MSKEKRKILVVILVVLCVIAVGLGVAICVNSYQQGYMEVSDEEQQQDDADENTWLYKGEDIDIDNKISEYQLSIDTIKNENPQAAIEIYQARVDFLMESKNNRNYADLILSDMIAIDNISRTVGSAIDVVNYANFFDNEELATQYTKILNDRQEMEGEDLNVEGRG